MYRLARCLFLALVAPALAAQAPSRDSASPPPHKPARLFRSREPVVMWLSADFKKVFRDRDSMSTKRYPGTLKYLGEQGDTVGFDVQLGTRGHLRLRQCEFVPLKVYFDKEKTKGTLFGGEGALKLTPHCMRGDRHAQNLYVEYAIYQMYNVLTPISLKVRLASITWLDPGDPKFTITRPAFWTQDEDDLAKELRGKVLMQVGAHAPDMDPRQMAITDVFQYMIANTDFSLSYLHNYRIFQTDTSTSYFPMAYDFDWSGLVDAPYAKPNPLLHLPANARVTDRLYRGGCHPPGLLADVIVPFKTKKDSIYGALRSIKELAPARLKEATSFLDEFYKELDDPGTIRRVFRSTCN